MEIKRGTIVLVNNDRIGLVMSLVRLPGTTAFGIAYQDDEKPFVKSAEPLRQLTDEEMDGLTDKEILAKHIPMIAVDLAKKIIGFRKALSDIDIG